MLRNSPSPRQMSSNSVSSISGNVSVDNLNPRAQNVRNSGSRRQMSTTINPNSNPFVDSIMSDLEVRGQSGVYDPNDLDLIFGTESFGGSRRNPPSVVPWFFAAVIAAFVITMTVFVIWAVYTYIVDTAPQAMEQIDDEIEKY